MNKFFLVAVFLILTLPAVLSLGIKLVPNGSQPSLNHTQKVYGEVKVSSDIISEFDNLSGMGLSIKNPNLINKKDINLSVYQGENVLRSVVLNGRSIGDGNFVKFIFEPIKDSKGQNYNVILAAPDANSSEALEIFLTNFPTGNPISVGKEVRSEGLSSVIFYRPDNRFSLVFNIYGSWLNKLNADRSFFVFYGLILLVGLGYLLKDSSFKKLN